MSYDQAQSYSSYYGGSPAGYYGDTYSYYNVTSSDMQYGYFISIFHCSMKPVSTITRFMSRKVRTLRL